MYLSSRFTIIGSALFLLISISCSKDSAKTVTFAETLPPTSRVDISFSETQVPGQCRVFSHLLIDIPAKMAESEIRDQVTSFARNNGADHILVGMSRESNDNPEALTFRTYGPQTAYSFRKRWNGWKFGFKDWNSGGPLIGYGHDHTDSDQAAFNVPIKVQAVLLTCQLGPKAPVKAD